MTFNILSKFGIFVIEDFLDAGLCTDLRTAARTAAMDQAAVYTKGVIRVNENVRRTKSAKITEPAASGLKARLLDLKPSLEAHFNLTLKGCNEPHLLVYREGDFFNPHRDNNRDPKERRVSVVIFLNRESKEIAPDCYGGGSLAFYELMDDPRCKAIGFPVVGKEGLLVAFAADRIHGVTPVTYGERLTIVTWFY
ncbi:MAG: 2OG-Fe(II) oxygenase [Acidobacteriota bacterium]|nr:2OG-Fe(II) oxygenase [Acidobacteriota bacterium]